LKTHWNELAIDKLYKRKGMQVYLCAKRENSLQGEKKSQECDYPLAQLDTETLYPFSTEEEENGTC
jgi:hypothetical protein